MQIEQHQTNYQSFSAGKQTPKLDFPVMRCSDHKCPVMLVCTKPDCRYKLFMCPKCISSQLQHINEHDPMLSYDDFVQLIQQQSGPSNEQSEDVNITMNSKDQRKSEFAQNINSQKDDVIQVAEKLSDLYQVKKDELVKSLQGILENENDMFNQNYTKFDNEVNCDKEREANILKFSELKDTIENMQDLSEIETFMKTVLRRKQAWDNASQDMIMLGKRSEDHFRRLIESQCQNMPKFVKAESIIQEWTNGLNNLIENIKQTTGCFTGLYKKQSGILLTIKTPQELCLLTNQMIKEDTEVCLQFQGDSIDIHMATQANQAISQLTNIQYIQLDFQNTSMSVECLREIFLGVEKLNKLTHLVINLEGAKCKNGAAQQVAEIIPQLAGSLQSLTLNLGFNDMTDDAVKQLALSTQMLTSLRCLDLNLKCNMIKEEGGKSWGSAIERLKKLQSLTLNFSGYSQIRNNLKDQGVTAITRAIKNCSRLSFLNLNFSHCAITDSSVLELAMSIKELQYLTNCTIQVNNNQVGEQGSRKLSKSFLQLPRLFSLYLNFNSNDIKTNGAREIVNAFRSKSTIQRLVLYLRNNGIAKSECTEFQNNLTYERNFENLELYV